MHDASFRSREAHLRGAVGAGGVGDERLVIGSSTMAAMTAPHACRTGRGGGRDPVGAGCVGMARDPLLLGVRSVVG